MPHKNTPSVEALITNGLIHIVDETEKVEAFSSIDKVESLPTNL